MKRGGSEVQLTINLSKIQYNAKVLLTLLNEHHVHFTPVTKCIAGDQVIVNELKKLGITHFADARIDNIKRASAQDITYTMLRSPGKNELQEIVKMAKISIQTELKTIKALNSVAKSKGTKHEILLMVDWKDAREGVLTYDVINYINEILKLHHICLVGLSFNFLCFNTLPPTEDDVEMINHFIETIETETQYHFKIISGGNSSMLTQMFYNDLGKINELRIGETLFRGVDTITSQPSPILFQNSIVLEGEILEIKPRLDMASGRHYLQAIIDIGYLDTAINGLAPLNKQVKIIGATSDHLMIDLLNCDYYQVGDKIEFDLNYQALAQSMYMGNIHKNYTTDNGIAVMTQSLNYKQLNRFKL